MLDAAKEESELDEFYDDLVNSYKGSDISAEEALDLIAIRKVAEERGLPTDDINDAMDNYFGDLDSNGTAERESYGMKSPDLASVEDTLAQVDDIIEAQNEIFEYEYNDGAAASIKKRYLLGVREKLSD